MYYLKEKGTRKKLSPYFEAFYKSVERKDECLPLQKAPH
jgi:hypothetical protein